MLHGIVILLKGLGICLGILAGLLVLIVLGMLFLPICYRMEGNWDRNKGKGKAGAMIRWCFGLISAHFYYETEAKWTVRVAFWKWGRDSLSEKEEEQPGEKSREKKGKKDEKETDQKETEQEETDPLPVGKMEPEDPVDQAGSDMEEGLEEMESAKKEKTGKSIVDRIRKLWEEIKRKFRKIRDAIRGLQDQKESLKEFLEDSIHQTAFQVLKKEVGIFLKKLKPKEIQGRIAFGFEDPGTTGYILAGLAVLYPIYQEKVEILPDFEEEVLEVEGSVCGRVYLWWVARLLAGLGCKKVVRITCRNIMEYKNNMSRRKGRNK